MAREKPTTTSPAEQRRALTNATWRRKRVGKGKKAGTAWSLSVPIKTVLTKGSEAALRGLSMRKVVIVGGLAPRYQKSREFKLFVEMATGSLTATGGELSLTA